MRLNVNAAAPVNISALDGRLNYRCKIRLTVHSTLLFHYETMQYASGDLGYSLQSPMQGHAPRSVFANKMAHPFFSCVVVNSMLISPVPSDMSAARMDARRLSADAVLCIRPRKLA